MARIRTVKPEFWSSPSTSSCEDPWARLLYIAMWNWADDAGRGTANPKELAGFAFPNDDKIDAGDIRRMLGEVRDAFGIVLYEVAGRPYYAIPSWDSHQKIDKRRDGRHPSQDDGRPWDPTPPDGGSRSRSAHRAEWSAHSRRSVEPLSGGPSDDAPEPERSAHPRRTVGAQSAQRADQGQEVLDQREQVDSAHRADTAPNSRRTLGAGTGEQGNRGTGETAPSELALVPRAAANEPAAAAEPDTPIKRAQALTRGYVERVPLSKFPAVLGVVRKAIRTERYTDDAIAAALTRLADDGRSVTTDTLRIELEGRPRQRGKPTTDDHVAGALRHLRPEPEQGTA